LANGSQFTRSQRRHKVISHGRLLLLQPEISHLQYQHLPGTPVNLRHLTSPALPSLPPARPQLPQANTRAESHSTLHHQECPPILHLALFLAAWMIQWHFGICGRWRAGTCHSPTPIGGAPRPALPSSVAYGECRWLPGRPQSHWATGATALSDPRRHPYPRACLLLHTSSSLLAEISALLASLACRQRAKNAQSLFCFCWMGASGLPG
jgi:hypothetical protein